MLRNANCPSQAQRPGEASQAQADGRPSPAPRAPDLQPDSFPARRPREQQERRPHPLHESQPRPGTRAPGPERSVTAAAPPAAAIFRSGPGPDLSC